MNHLLIRHHSSHSLLILFLGWGFPPEAFAGLHKDGFDLLILSGYTTMAGEELDREIKDWVYGPGEDCYNEIIVIGWSFGVRAATEFLAETNLPVTLRLAINGTISHIDDHNGIPESIFRGTLSRLDGSTLAKFRLRCVSDRDRLTRLMNNVTLSDDIDRVKEELALFGRTPSASSDRKNVWDKIIIGEKDRIFPPDNQRKSWNGNDVFIFDDMAHTPDFQWILDNFIVDKQKVSEKFSLAVSSYSDNALSQQHVAQRLYSKFRQIFDHSELKAGATYSDNNMSLIELGVGSGVFTRRYFPQLIGHCQKIMLSDIQISFPDESLCRFITDCEANANVRCEFIHGDAESVEMREKYLLPVSYDLIFSASMFQWLNSPATMLRSCAEALRHGGIMALSFYGPGTCREIQHIAGAGLKYPSAEWMSRTASEAGLSVDLVETEEEVLLFDTPTEALRHLRLTGVNALPGNSSPTAIRKLLADWPVTPDLKATLTFRPVYIILSKH